MYLNGRSRPLRDVVNDNEDSNNSMWLGTRIWPIEVNKRESSEKMIGKGRPDSCACSSPGSVNRIRFHVSTARLHLKSELGKAFFSWGFDKMGEDLSKFWTNEEQMRFDDLIKLNPALQNMSFWEPALEYFPSKSRRDIENSYFNVYVPRRMSKQTRSAYRIADSHDDENNANAHDDVPKLFRHHAPDTLNASHASKCGFLHFACNMSGCNRNM